MDHLHWFALKSVPQIGNVLFRRLLAHFGTPERALAATEAELSAVKGMNQGAISALRSHDGRAFAEAERDRVAAGKVAVVDILSPDYPKPLLEIADPPPFLYLAGTIAGYEPAIAIVGSRRASPGGLAITTRLARDLAARGITVVSGLARGIDAAAHWGALKGGGRSIAVLGCGVDVVYPLENAVLYAELAARGGIVSEFSMGSEPIPENFPRRNRIISALCAGVLVVEAGEKSGSLITARFALEQGREVFAVPGNVNMSSSRGGNALIKAGAKLVERVEDILEELPYLSSRPATETSEPSFSFSPEEGKLYDLLRQAPLQIDDIIVQSALTVGEVSAILLRLELKGAIVQLPGKHFAIA
ncbi:DNA-processing protein DprA [Geomonas sp. RF6]|uniref:DNA-processing protein DprA n=1 Tax=Geomonas sp. RF6 TaxID=2897342 RepID=UPI001E2B0D1D|nr:DNA-processing protein DprA [Geomonas sp. RF6]UFS68572.1 DNA-processing protein DprA [Geomonas sp. RF6]